MEKTTMETVNAYGKDLMDYLDDSTYKTNVLIAKILDSGKMPLGCRYETSLALAHVIGHGDINSNVFVGRLQSEVVAREIYKDECYRTPMSNNDFRNLSDIAAMIPLNIYDEHNDELVISLLLEAYIRGKERIEALFRFLPGYIKAYDGDGARYDLEEILDWVDTEINGGSFDLTLISHDEAEKEIIDLSEIYDGEKRLLAEKDIAALTEILSHISMKEAGKKRVAAELIGSYCEIVSDYLYEY